MYSRSIYKVTWEIEIEAKSPRHAAEKAREIQLRPESLATFFEIRRIEKNSRRNTVDLSAGH